MCLADIEKYAVAHNVPIMEHDSLEYMLDYIKSHNVKTILEIGTAIGYSAIKMALVALDIKVTTIERDKDRYNKALEYIKGMGLNEQIDVIYGDALEVEVNNEYDLMFIDAAKAQSIKFFNKYAPLLNSKGTIITDNINFHGLTFGNTEMSKNVRNLTKKIRAYLDFLKDNRDFTTEYVNIGDGITISVKKD